MAPDDAIDNGLATAAATMAEWRSQGADRRAPVRFRFIEIMAARAAQQQGDSRRILQARVAALIAAYGADHARPASAKPDIEIETEASTAPPAPERSADRSPLADLVNHIARHAAPHARPAASDAAPALETLPELKALTFFKGTWSRLKADQRLSQSRIKLPENAGPLNSHHLVHQALTLMRELSPVYLDRFMCQIDTLTWLDRSNDAAAPARGPATAQRARGKEAKDGKSGGAPA
jgi:Protein of unknown function (DUF2894)